MKANDVYYKESLSFSPAFKYCPASFKKLAMIIRITKATGKAAMMDTVSENDKTALALFHIFFDIPLKNGLDFHIQLRMPHD